MVEQDYIRRLLLYFLQKLAAFLSKKNYEEADIRLIDRICQDAFSHNREFLMEQNIDTLLKEMGSEYFSDKLKLLAMIFELEAKITLDQTQTKMLWQKSLLLLEQISRNSTIYDLDMELKISSLRDRIKDA